jgi:ATP-dependent DNA ligase
VVDQPPEGEGWIHEVKFDGDRAQIVIENDEARVFNPQRLRLVDEILVDRACRPGATLRAVDAMGLDGVVSKRADSGYRSGPSKSRLKSKCFVEADLEVLGVVQEQGEAPLALLTAAGSRK